ncbi:MAG: hypothetical protein LC635_05080 [Pseudonocardiaceae bacterium]|nr:hypothetical protein [Pseudonocardiaceae bacterium]
MSELPGTHRVGPFHVTGVELPHFVPNAGVRLTTPHRTLAYTGDTGPAPALADLGRDADLYIMDATLQREPAPGPRHVLAAAEAGYWATQANARRLLLTHFWPGDDRAVSLRQAAEHYRGELLAADEGMTVVLD